MVIALLPALAPGARAQGTLPYESYEFEIADSGRRWSIDIKINADGSFSGGGGGPTGMAGMLRGDCEFKGHFTDITKERYGVWSMRVDAYELTRPEGEVEYLESGIQITYGDDSSAPHVGEVWYIYEPVPGLSWMPTPEHWCLYYDDPYETFHLMREQEGENTIGKGTATGYTYHEPEPVVPETVRYFGDEANTRMTGAQAQAFADALRNAGKSFERVVLADFGDGVPVMVAGEMKRVYVASDEQDMMSGCVCQWDGQNTFWWDSFGRNSTVATVLWPEGISLSNRYDHLASDLVTWGCFYTVSGGTLSGKPQWGAFVSTSDAVPQSLPWGASLREIATVCTEGLVEPLGLDWGTFQENGWYYSLYGGDVQGFCARHNISFDGSPFNVRDFIASSGPDGVRLEDVGVSAEEMIAYLEDYARRNSKPVYAYPLLDAGDPLYAGVTEGIAGVVDVYRLSDSLFYVLAGGDGSYTGTLVKGTVVNGLTVWVTVTTGEPMGQEELESYVATELTRPNLQVDYEEATQAKSGGELAEALRQMLSNIDGLTPNDPAKEALTRYIEAGLSAVYSSAVKGQDNVLALSAGTVGQLMDDAAGTARELEDILRAAGVTLNKEFVTVLRLLWSGVDLGTTAQVVLAPGLAGILRGRVEILLGDGTHILGLDGESLDALLREYGTLAVQIGKNGDVYTVTFVDSNGNVIARLTAPVTVALPAASATGTVMAGYASGSTNWGGQYDESSGTMSFDVYYSGTYEVVDNSVEITDIGDLDAQTQEAIRFLVSKGFMSADGGDFGPGGYVWRYHFTRSLVGMFYALNNEAVCTFTDVAPGSLYYVFVASGQEANLVKGISETEFAGENVLTVEQMLTFTGRTLQEQRGYALPEDPGMYLAAFTDGEHVAEWARAHTALSVREGLVTAGGELCPQQPVTRAQAALILYRLFLKLHTVRPVPLPLPEVPEEPEPPATDVPETETPETDAPEEPEAEPKGFDWTVAILAFGGGVCAAAVGVLIATRVKTKRKK